MIDLQQDRENKSNDKHRKWYDAKKHIIELKITKKIKETRNQRGECGSLERSTSPPHDTHNDVDWPVPWLKLMSIALCVD